MEGDSMSCPKCQKRLEVIDGIFRCVDIEDCGYISPHQPVAPSYQLLLSENNRLRELLAALEERLAHYEIDRI